MLSLKKKKKMGLLFYRQIPFTYSFNVEKDNSCGVEWCYVAERCLGLSPVLKGGGLSGVA